MFISLRFRASTICWFSFSRVSRLFVERVVSTWN